MLTQLPIEKITLQMSKKDVLFLLGPAHIDPSRPETWSYLYQDTMLLQDKIFMIHFNNDKVIATTVNAIAY